MDITYLADRKQRVALPDAQSDWILFMPVYHKVQFLVPCYFSYINAVVTDIGSNKRLFADDTSLDIIVDNPNTARGNH